MAAKLRLHGSPCMQGPAAQSPQPAVMVVPVSGAGSGAAAAGGRGGRGCQALRAPGAAAELSSSDFAALLASGTAGINAIPYGGSFTSGGGGPSAPAPSVSPPVRLQPLDPAAFGGGRPAAAPQNRQPLPLLGPPSGLSRSQVAALPAGTPSRITASPSLDEAAARHSRASTDQVAARMAALENLAEISR